MYPVSRLDWNVSDILVNDHGWIKSARDVYWLSGMATTAQNIQLLPESTPDTSAKPKPARAKFVLIGLTSVAVVAAAAILLLGRGKESTDDAQIEGHVANVAPRVAGQVSKVLVIDNQAVKAGDILVEIDDRDYAVKVTSARADLAASEATLVAAETNVEVTHASVNANVLLAKGGLSQAGAVEGNTAAAIDQAKAEVVSAESKRALALLDLDRVRKMYETSAVSKAELDLRQALYDQSVASVGQSEARLKSAKASLANSTGTFESARGRWVQAQSGPAQVAAQKAQVSLARARVDQAKAALDQAELNLGYTKIRAQTDGVISRRNVEVGQLVSPDRPLLAVVNLDDTWLVANFKEDQVAKMTPGQKASVEVDAFSGKKLAGHIESLAAGTGSRFSLLPPDNASGNFTKVVQRVPVLIALEPHPGVVLRPGMSATAVVDVKSAVSLDGRKVAEK